MGLLGNWLAGYDPEEAERKEAALKERVERAKAVKAAGGSKEEIKQASKPLSLAEEITPIAPLSGEKQSIFRGFTDFLSDAGAVIGEQIGIDVPAPDPGTVGTDLTRSAIATGKKITEEGTKIIETVTPGIGFAALAIGGIAAIYFMQKF